MTDATEVATFIPKTSTIAGAAFVGAELGKEV